MKQTWCRPKRQTWSVRRWSYLSTRRDSPGTHIHPKMRKRTTKTKNRIPLYFEQGFRDGKEKVRQQQEQARHPWSHLMCHHSFLLLSGYEWNVYDSNFLHKTVGLYAKTVSYPVHSSFKSRPDIVNILSFNQCCSQAVTTCSWCIKEVMILFHQCAIVFFLSLLIGALGKPLPILALSVVVVWWLWSFFTVNPVITGLSFKCYPVMSCLYVFWK